MVTIGRTPDKLKSQSINGLRSLWVLMKDSHIVGVYPSQEIADRVMKKHMDEYGLPLKVEYREEGDTYRIGKLVTDEDGNLIYDHKGPVWVVWTDQSYPSVHDNPR